MDLILFLLTIYLLIGAGVAVYAFLAARPNPAALLLVVLFWPLFLLIGVQSGVLGGQNRKQLK